MSQTPLYDAGLLSARAPHRATATLTFFKENGDKETVEADVFYRGLSLDETEEFPDLEGLEGKERAAAVAKQLAFLVLSIPLFGVGVGDEFSVKPDEKYFGGMDTTHVDAISKAIEESTSPNTSASNS
ncbi:MAG: hypothetical protein LC803_16625 [Acidobacteria bacterium]|nr:hypothetical protein [Acidobacteriota bacterium]